MPLSNIFNIAGSAMSAQSVRLNTVASNMANADSVAGSEAEAYRARQPVFQAVMDGVNKNNSEVGVKVLGIVESQQPLRKEYSPGHPMANEEGYIYLPNVNPIEEMANMMAASRAYRNNVEVMNTSRQLIMNTLRLGQ